MASMGERLERYYIELDARVPMEVDEDGCVYMDVLDEFGRTHTIDMTDYLSGATLLAAKKQAKEQKAEAIAYEEARR